MPKELQLPGSSWWDFIPYSGMRMSPHDGREGRTGQGRSCTKHWDGTIPGICHLPPLHRLKGKLFPSLPFLQGTPVPGKVLGAHCCLLSKERSDEHLHTHSSEVPNLLPEYSGGFYSAASHGGFRAGSACAAPPSWKATPGLSAQPQLPAGAQSGSDLGAAGG